MAWLTGWNRRKQLYINGTSVGSQSLYQMYITVYYGSGTDSGGNIYCSSNCRADFGDIRFTDSDGSTQLNYWIESSISSSYAKIWVKIPSIPTGTNSAYIYIYYNNTSATTSSNGTNTFLFFDDCSGTTYTNKWTQTDIVVCYDGGASTYEGSGLLTQDVPAYSGHGGDSGTTISATGLSLGNNIEYYIRIPTLTFYSGGWSSYALFLNGSGSWKPTTTGVNNWWCSSNRYGPSNGLDIEFGYNGSNQTTNFWLYNINNSTKAQVATVSGMALTNFILKVTYNAPNVIVSTSTDGVTWTQRMSWSAAPVYTGTIVSMFGGCCDRGSRLQYSFFRVRNYASTEPTWSSTGTEQSVTLNINSTPTGATIYLRTPQGVGSYISQGVTTNNTLYVPAGTYDIKLTLAGYQDWYLLNQSYTAGQTANINATLTLIPGSLGITSTPSGASIYINGVLQVGVTTPATITGLNPSPPSYSITLTLTGYQNWTGTSDVISNSTTNVIATFSPSAYFTSIPSGASIYIDAILQGSTTPATITNLSVGSHAYMLILIGYNVESGNFTTTGGQTTNISRILSGTAVAFLAAGD